LDNRLKECNAGYCRETDRPSELLFRSPALTILLK
jgi:hypothetical protein